MANLEKRQGNDVVNYHHMEILKAAKLKLEELQLTFTQHEGEDNSMEGNESKSPRWSWLSHLVSKEQPEDAADLAALFSEAAPMLTGMHRYESRELKKRSHSKLPRTLSRIFRGTGLKQRLRSAIPLPSSKDSVEWTRLHEAISTEEVFAIEQEDNPMQVCRTHALECNSPGSDVLEKTPGATSHSDSMAITATTPGGSLVVNSGGKVFFCMFEPELSISPGPTPPVSRQLTPLQMSSMKGSFVSEGDLYSLYTSFEAKSGMIQSRSSKSVAGTNIFSSPHSEDMRSHHDIISEGCLVIKFTCSRLLCQSEQFAAELAKYLGVAVPDCRIVRKTDEEWDKIVVAADRLGAMGSELANELSKRSCLLVMEYVPSKSLLSSNKVFRRPRLRQTCNDIGRLFALDMLLGNSDRLQCQQLGWRGNPDNVLAAKSGRWEGRLVAIDALVQRRPPGGLLSKEDADCERLTELALNDDTIALDTLKEALSGCSAAVAVLDSEDKSLAVQAFLTGLRDGLKAMMELKGLLEMMFNVISAWIDEFLKDIEASHASEVMDHLSPAEGKFRSNTTMKIRQINEEATKKPNTHMSEKVAEWKAILRARGQDLSKAVEEWQIKKGCRNDDDAFQDGMQSLRTSRGIHCGLDTQQNLHGTSRLTTGFLDGSHPIVDTYELKVRLEHMLQRLRALQVALATARPTKLIPGLFVSGAVAASSLHILRHLGITHILNATEDLLFPEEEHNFVHIRVPLKDVEEEDVECYFEDANRFIDAALGRKGGVLVHCHAGQSRSCCLVLSWLMTRRQWTLRRALTFLHEYRPQAALNAGYMEALSRLEERLFGTQTVKIKKTKPPLKRCPVCGYKIGLSTETVKLHLRRKHPKCLSNEYSYSEESSPADVSPCS